MADTKIKQHVPIFISSTYEDLIPYRDEVQRNLIHLEQIIKGMEYFGSSPKNPLKVCLSQIKDCKLYIGIIGMRYGSIDDESGFSYTQLEYNEAIKNGIPTLIYIMDENYPIAPKFVDRDNKAEKLQNFKTELKRRHTVSFFTSPDDLGKKISKDVVEALSTLEEINVDSQIIEAEKENYLDVINKFLLRPAKYQGIEGTLKMKVVSGLVGSTLKTSIVDAFGLELGNTISVDVNILNPNNTVMKEAEIAVYADGNCADWLENVSTNCIISAKVKTAFCEIKELTSWDEGRVLRTFTHEGLIITKGLSIEKE